MQSASVVPSGRALQPGARLAAGDVERELDPYFPFEGAVDAWARCFAALGIQYRGATMRLDLCDRPGKYSNGFCHWPQVPPAPIPAPVLCACAPLPPHTCVPKRPAACLRQCSLS